MIPSRDDVIQQTRVAMLAIVNSATAKPDERIQAAAVLLKLEANLLNSERLAAQAQAQ